MRLTRAGVVAVLAVPALAAVAWLFGQPELAIAAVAIGVCLVAAAATVVRSRPKLDVRRTIRPIRVMLGEPCQVRLEVRNSGRRRTRVLGLRDDVGVFGEASLHLAPLRAGSGSLATYSFPTQRRGLHPIGPLSVDTEDAFGLLRTRKVITDVHTAIVVPLTWPLAPLPRAIGDEPEHGTRVLTSTSTVDEEFAAMRPYTVGDDIRRIHWRTTARTGEPVVRQYDQPWQRRTTVLVDLRRSPYSAPHPSGDLRFDEPAFERAVSAAASLVRLSADGGELVRLISTDGTDSGFVAADAGLDDLLDRLAAVEPTVTVPGAAAPLSAALAPLGTRPSGRLVTVTGRLSRQETDLWSRAAHGFGLRVLLRTDLVGDGRGAGDAGAAPIDTGTITVRWDGTRTLTDAWSDTIGTQMTAADRSAPLGSPMGSPQEARR